MVRSHARRCLAALALMVLLFGTVPAAVAAISFVQGTYEAPASASSVSVKYAAAQKAGDLNVVIIGWNDSTSRVNSITDSKGNVYLAAVGPTQLAGDATQVIYYAQNIAAAAAGANTITVTFNVTVKAPDVRILEYGGISTANAFDVGVGSTGNSGTSMGSGVITTSAANELLIGTNYIGTSYAGTGAGYTRRILTSPNSDLVEDQVVSATGSYSATALQSPASWWVMQLAAFRMAPGSTDTSPPSSPGTPTASVVSATQVSLGWAASSDNVGVTGYLIERCQGAGCTAFAQIGASPSTTYLDSSTSASNTYSYRVRATDAAGNLSAYSGTVSITIPAASGVISAVQKNYATPHAASSAVTLAYSSAQIAGDLNVVVVGWYPGAGVHVNAVSDSSNNAYLLAVGPTSNGYATESIYYAKSIAGSAAGANKVTVSFSGAVPEADIRLAEYSGLDPVNPLDVTAAATGSSTALNSGSVTTGTANELLVGADMIYSSYAAAGAGYTARVVSAPNGDLLEDRVVNVAGSYSASSTQASAGWWLMQLATFRMAGGGLSAISPRNAALTLSQRQQFTTNASPGTPLTWAVDGVTGGNSTVGTISTSGLYTPPSLPGTHTVSASNPANPASTLSATVAVTDLAAVATYHNDLARTGQNLQEYALTAATVSSGSFGKRWSCPLDGTAYAQPLYVANLLIGGAIHNVVFVATMHDSIYAIDADNSGCIVYWKDSFINPSASITTISSSVAGCGSWPGEYGILGTPVIDPASQTLFLVANTSESGAFYQRLHALDLATGTEKANSPAIIQATVPGAAAGGSTVSFNALNQNQRPALALFGGGVFIGWSSRCDNASDPWNGWIMRYDESTLSQTAVFNATPNLGGGGIWMSGGAPAVDSGGSLYLSTGNGGFDDTASALPPLAPNNDFGGSFLRIDPTTLAVQDFYAPSQTAVWTANDLDISASGLTVLPDGAGPAAHPNVLVASDKQGHLWMIDRTSMSGYVPNGDNTVQYLTLPDLVGCAPECVFSTPAYWNGTVYIAVNGGPVMALPLSNGLLPQSAGVAVPASMSTELYAAPAPTASLSASPMGGALLWVLDNGANGEPATLGPAILRAYDATNLAKTLYSSAKLAVDAGGNAAKFALPVVANGHVYIAGAGALTVYGLAP